MNIVLVPYTAWRHLAMALWCGGFGLLAWWLVLSITVIGGPIWTPDWDGPILLTAISAAVAGASILGEDNLRRRPLLQRVGRAALAVVIAVANTLLWYWLWHLVVPMLLPEDWAADAADLSLVSLRYRVGAFVMGGLACGLAGTTVRRFSHVVSHVAGGIASAMVAGAAWHVLNSNFTGLTDLYLSGAALGLVWGFLYGLITWPIPDRLYAGWIRVLSSTRYGRRIPVDAANLGPKERFLGHFPRGLDMFLPVEAGVMELHVSVAVDADGNYKARGLSLHPTTVKRFLEKVDLRYDPRRPAPLETRLSSGDRILLGQGDKSVEVEFVMLPREER
ncbi:MAG: hypothetical protein H6742_00095 [Alphaproteobacteria bacterium]|nr:hypothetical protein [Alphaproteobacteria bacterium]